MRDLVAERPDEDTDAPRPDAEDGAAADGTPARGSLGRLLGRGRDIAGRMVTPALVGVVAAGVVLRFVTTSDLWLDEALSVNIASLGLGDLFEALRRDGHPPLYYVLLHYWMEVVGEGDVAVRALSGLFAVASLPLAWVVGRRLGGPGAARWSLVLVALSPYWIRYASETRMYSLVMLLVLAGWLLLDGALRRPTPMRLGGLAVVSGLLLLSHYWAFWLIGSVGLLLIGRLVRRPDDRPATGRVLGAVAAGGLLFLPWLPGFLYQMAHTGTPWAGPVRPTMLVEMTLRDLGGGPLLSESFLYGAGVLMLCLVALFAVGAARKSTLVLDLRTTSTVRSELAVVGLTAAVGCITAYLASATFQPRYAAVFIPLLLVAAGVGLSLLPGSARALLGGAMVVLSVFGIGWHLYFERSQSGEIAAAVAEHAQPGDVVLYCPDQLGPAYSRVMPDGLREVVYPTLAGPERVDWVDYADRNAAADYEEIAADIEALAGGGAVFVISKDGYETFGEQCQQVRGRLSHGRTSETLVEENGKKYYEPAELIRISLAG